MDLVFTNESGASNRLSLFNSKRKCKPTSEDEKKLKTLPICFPIRNRSKYCSFSYVCIIKLFFFNSSEENCSIYSVCVLDSIHMHVLLISVHICYPTNNRHDTNTFLG